MGKVATLALAGVLFAVPFAAAQNPGVPAPKVQPPLIDLSIQQSIQNRQIFDAEQRRYRAEDRIMNSQPAPRLEVPVMTPRCVRGSPGNPPSC